MLEGTREQKNEGIGNSSQGGLSVRKKGHRETGSQAEEQQESTGEKGIERHRRERRELGRAGGRRDRQQQQHQGCVGSRVCQLWDSGFSAGDLPERGFSRRLQTGRLLRS